MMPSLNYWFIRYAEETSISAALRKLAFLIVVCDAGRRAENSQIYDFRNNIRSLKISGDKRLFLSDLL